MPTNNRQRQECEPIHSEASHGRGILSQLHRNWCHYHPLTILPLSHQQYVSPCHRSTSQLLFLCLIQMMHNRSFHSSFPLRILCQLLFANWFILSPPSCIDQMWTEISNTTSHVYSSHYSQSNEMHIHQWSGMQSELHPAVDSPHVCDHSSYPTRLSTQPRESYIQ